ncbi:MFS transporter [Brevibacillus fluminis]|uniref:MFS transporter n=1 Tax=Brevibacillus fluminis TaxID=511487 RepID=A0A3M8DTQ2_9BACL|nr:MFS transporter [Brevibacillus fluminis]RNB91462.1 MFS transporter [Brevibacillus fluminis]
MMPTPSRVLYRNPSFTSIWIGEAASSLGGSFGTVANSWLLFQITGTGLEAALGSMWLIYMLPSLLVQLVIGPYLDRWNKQRVMLFSQIARALLFCFPLLMSLNGHLQPWHIFVVSLGNGLIQPLYVPSSMALLPSLLDEKQLPQANAVIDGTSRLMMFLGPPAGGLLVALIGAPFTLTGIILLYLASGALLLRCRPIHQQQEQKRETWAAQLIAGFRYFFAHKQLVWLSVFLAFVQFAVGVTMVLYLPFVVQTLGGSSFTYGLFIAMFPLGYFLGSLLVPRFSSGSSRHSGSVLRTDSGQYPNLSLRADPRLRLIPRLRLHFRRWLGQGLPLRIVMLGSILLGGSTFFALSLVHHIWIALLIELFAGITSPFFQVHSTTLYQCTVPADMRGRVFSVRLLIIRSVMPLGTLFGSVCAPIWGIRPIFAFIGGVICLAAFVGVVVPWFRFLDGGNLGETSVDKKSSA